ncbi:MAG: ABC transporter permease [Thalassobaculaceae bacterium]
MKQRKLTQAFYEPNRNWLIASVLIAIIITSPIIAIIWIAISPEENVWLHLATSVLPTYIFNSVVLMLGVGTFVAIMGTGTAWLVAMCEFPGAKIFAWALILPMAMPAYVVAYVYTDFLEFAGPVQTSLRMLFSWTTSSDYWFPQIRSLGGAITVLSLVLYPYVYALTRASFLEQSISTLEAGRVLGLTGAQNFFYTSLPLARPAIVVGVTLCLMETLSDFGTVDYFAVRTLTVGIFDVWFGMENRGGAAQIALVLLSFIIILIWLERSSRKRQRFHNSSKNQSMKKIKLKGWRSSLAIVSCLVPIVTGFVLPGAILFYHALNNIEGFYSTKYIEYAGNSFTMAGSATLIIVLTGIFLAYAARICPNLLVKIAVRVASIGYAIPGAALAIGILISIGAIDSVFTKTAKLTFGFSANVLIGGGLAALLFGYTTRFLAIALGSAEAGLSKVTYNMDMAARTLGSGPRSTLFSVHAPLIRSSIISGSVLVFVDIMKELPATLILRPFNFETLATFVYQYASDELLNECAPAALTIVLAGLLPVLLLNRAIDNKKK